MFLSVLDYLKKIIIINVKLSIIYLKVILIIIVMRIPIDNYNNGKK